MQVIRALHILGQIAELLVGVGVVERRWDRDRRRRVTAMLDGERTGRAAAIAHAQAMAIQLAEIRALPESPERPW